MKALVLVAAVATEEPPPADSIRAAVRDGMATLGPLATQIIAQLSSLEI